MNVNVRGTIDLIRQVLPHMARTAPTAPDNERGVIIMVASSAAFDGQPGQVAYAASKGAIRSLTLPLTRRDDRAFALRFENDGYDVG
jgi:3-hydroxyacyl-CoA dehydrogenase/3-hydroxy-2-methylbutyryl-CoA dehydrogenase